MIVSVGPAALGFCLRTVNVFGSYVLGGVIEDVVLI